VDEALLSRIEDAGLNASAPPQQRWLDGWLLRFNPGKAKRARCINAVATGRLPLQDRLNLAAQVYREAGLPMVFRITPFTQPGELDQELADRGCVLQDETRVMVARALTGGVRPLPPGLRWVSPDAGAFAEVVGALRGSPPAQRLAHAERLAATPVPLRGCALQRIDDDTVVACGQFAREANLVGLYDVFTHAAARGQGLATLLCERLLAAAVSQGATVGYLQVDAGNDAARHIYHRLGFADAYAYHYREAL
jgi:GNAT superfamily N-acetyltransferase